MVQTTAALLLPGIRWQALSINPEEYQPLIVDYAVGLDPGWSSPFALVVLALLEDCRVVVTDYCTCTHFTLAEALQLAISTTPRPPSIWGCDPQMFNHCVQTGLRDADVMEEMGLHAVASVMTVPRKVGFMRRMFDPPRERRSVRIDTRQFGYFQCLQHAGANPDCQHGFDAGAYGLYALVTRGVDNRPVGAPPVEV